MTKPLKALANERRLRIVSFLKKKREKSVGTISQHMKLSVRSVSKHLAVLRLADIVEKEQRSKMVFYKVKHDMPVCAEKVISLL